MQNSYKSLVRRLTKAGFPRRFIETAILPDWWDESCAEDPSVLPDIEFRISRFLGLSLGQVRDPKTVLLGSVPGGVRLRHTQDLNADRLQAAIHAGTAIAAAVARNCRREFSPANLPSTDAGAWREELSAGHGTIELEDVVRDLWQRGIPVVHVQELPSPKYQGMVCVVEDRPVVVLGRAHDEPPRVAFFIAHEAGHIVHGDCAPDQPVIDETESVDVSETEVRADEYALKLLAGTTEVPLLDADDFRDLARHASELEGSTGIGAGFLVWSWANRTGAFKTGVMALKALYLHRGAKSVLERHFEENVDLESASETDRSLLACVSGVGNGDDDSAD